MGKLRAIELDLVDVIVGYVIVTSGVMLVQLVTARFEPFIALLESLLICAAAALVFVRRIVVPGDPRVWVTVALMSAVTLMLRWDPFLYVEGGQDEGVYVSMSAYFARTHGLEITDRVREKLPEAEKPAYDRLNNRYDPANAQLRGRSEGEHLPGIFIGDLSRSAYVFQFYPLHPLWMAVAAKVLGDQHRVYSLVAFSLLDVLMLSLLAYELSGRKRGAAFLAAALLAINPMHVFLSRFPVTENVIVFFSASALYYLVRYFKAAESDRGQGWNLVASTGAWAGLFFTHIAGFLYAPVLLAALLAGTVSARTAGRALGLLGYGLGVMLAYALSLWYGMTWSFPYSYGTYVGLFGVELGTLFVDHWKEVITLGVIGYCSLSHLAWHFRARIHAQWTRSGIDQALAGVLLTVLLLTAAYGTVEAYRLGFTTDYSLLSDPRDRQSVGFDAAGQNWLYQRSQLSNTGVIGFVHSSLMALAIYVSPFILLFVLFALIVKRRAIGIYEIIVMMSLTWFMVLRTGLESLTLYYYYGRYLGAELVPYLLVLAAVWLYPALESVKRGRRVIAGVILGLSLTWEATALAQQYSTGEMHRLDAGLRPSFERIGNRDLVIIAGGAVPKLTTALSYYYGKNTVLVEPDTLKGSIAQYSKHWSEIYVLSNRDNLPDLRNVGTLTIAQDTYARGGAYDVLPVGSAATEASYYLYQADRSELVRQEEQAGATALSIDFTKGQYPAEVASVQGISQMEKSGRWTDGATARLRFTRPLPLNFTLDLDVVDAYGPNRNLPVKIRIGGEEREFIPAQDSRPMQWQFDLRRPADTIEIDIPKPTSPQSVGESNDSRRVGIRLASLRVTPQPPK